MTSEHRLRSVEDVRRDLPAVLAGFRAGQTRAFSFGEGVVLTYQPPSGVVDDPTRRTYATEPLPDSKPFSLDEWAEGDPFTQQILDEIRSEEGLPPHDR